MDAVHPSIPLEAWLRIAQNFFRGEVVRNFLLDSSSSSDLGILTSKAHSKHAVIGTIGIQFLKENHFSSLFGASWLFIPAFCFQNYSALLLTQEQGRDAPLKEATPCTKALSPCAKLVAPSQLKFTRYVRDDDTATSIAVDVNEESSKVSMMLISTDLPKRVRQRVHFEVDRASLERGNIAEMKQSISFYMHFTENLVCNQCSVAVGNECDCALPKPSRPLHPLDLETSARNLGLYSGAYSGLYTALMAFGGSENICSQNFIVGNFQGGAAPGTIERLHSWAISNSLAKYFSTVPISNLPFSTELVSKAHRTIAEYLPVINTNTASSSPSSSGFFNGTMTSLDPIPIIGTSAPILPIMNAASSSSPSHNEIFVNQAPMISEEEISTGSTKEIILPIMDDGSPISGALFASGNGFTNEADVAIVSNDDGIVPVLNGYSSGLPGSGTGTGTSSIMGSVGYDIDGMIEASVIGTPDTQRATSQSGTPPGDLRLPKTIRPMKINRTRATVPEMSRLPVDNSSEAKAIRRKIRNRESAARSNMKRRNGLAALKKDLSQGRERLKDLQQKYEQVKATNCMLRKEVEGVRLEDEWSVSDSRLSSR